MCGHMEIRAKAHQWRTRAAGFQRVLHQPRLQCLQSLILRRSCPAGGLKYHGQRTLTCNSSGTFSNPIYSDSEVYPKSVLASCKCRSVGIGQRACTRIQAQITDAPRMLCSAWPNQSISLVHLRSQVSVGPAEKRPKKALTIEGGSPESSVK